MNIWKAFPIFSLMVVVAIALLSPPAAVAGPYTDALSMCMVRHASAADKSTLVQWMFAVMALHPDVQPMAAVSPQQRDELNKGFAELTMRLLTESCATEAREALRYEGPSAMEASFAVLGQVASRELFTNPLVAEGMGGLENHIDEARLDALMAEPEPEQN